MNSRRSPITILLADDDEDDLQVVKEALQKNRLGNDIRTTGDGEELLDYLLRRGRYTDPSNSPRPGVILLDVLDSKRRVIAVSLKLEVLGQVDLVSCENPFEVGARDPSHGNVRQGHVLKLKGDPLRVRFGAAK